MRRKHGGAKLSCCVCWTMLQMSFRVLILGYLSCLYEASSFLRLCKAGSSNGFKGTWCSGITSASHAEGPGLKSQCVHLFIMRSLRAVDVKCFDVHSYCQNNCTCGEQRNQEKRTHRSNSDIFSNLHNGHMMDAVCSALGSKLPRMVG